MHPTGSITTKSPSYMLEEDFDHFRISSCTHDWQCLVPGARYFSPHGSTTTPTYEWNCGAYGAVFQEVPDTYLPSRRELQAFLMHNWCTLLALGLSSSELLNGWQIHAKLDALLPWSNHIVKGKQASEATKAQRKEQNHPVSRLVHTYMLRALC